MSARLRRQCKHDYERLRDHVLEFLIWERWVAGEVSELGLALSGSELDDAFEQAKRESFDTEREFRAFLRRSGMTYGDARFQIAHATLDAKLRQAAIANAAPVTDRDVEAYYELHREEFVRPELRDLRLVVTRTRGAAVTARRALERGQSWRHVARKHSIDKVSKNNGGKLTGVARGTLDEELDEALFRAPQRKLRGPVKGRFGYLVFKVLKITAAEQQTLAQASREIRQRLAAERAVAAEKAFETALRRKWKARTICRTGFVINLCAGTPEPGEHAAIRYETQQRATGWHTAPLAAG